MRGRVSLYRIAVIACAVAGLSGCALFRGKDDSPAWFRQRVNELEEGRYPQLAAVPEPTPSRKSAAEWHAAQQDVENARQALEANPRAAPASPGASASAGAFEAQARKEAAPARPER